MIKKKTTKERNRKKVTVVDSERIQLARALHRQKNETDEREKNATTTHRIEWKKTGEIKWSEKKKSKTNGYEKHYMFSLRWFLDLFDDRRFYPNVFFLILFPFFVSWFDGTIFMHAITIEKSLWTQTQCFRLDDRKRSAYDEGRKGFDSVLLLLL